MSKVFFLFRYEVRQWLIFLTRHVPGNIGAMLRNITWGYRYGKGSTIGEGAYINDPSRLVIGRNVSINRYSIIHAGGGIDIGDDVLVGPRVTIYSQNHAFKDGGIDINKQGYIHKKVIIERDVWIAAGAIILPGSHIQEGAVIGAGAVVRGVVSKGGVVIGNPATEVSRRDISVES